MFKLTLSCILGLLITTNICNAEKTDLKDKRIGVINRLSDFATLIYTENGFRPGYIRRKVFNVSHWNVSSEFNAMLVNQLKENGFTKIKDLNIEKEELFTHYYLQDNKLGQKYINKLLTQPIIKTLDYLVIVVPGDYLVKGQSSTTAVGYVPITIPGKTYKIPGYGFYATLHSNEAFFATSYMLFDIKNKRTSYSFRIDQFESFTDDRKLSKQEQDDLFQYVTESLDNDKYIKVLKKLIYKSDFDAKDKEMIKEIFTKEFYSEYDDDLENDSSELDQLLDTQLIRVNYFARQIAQGKDKNYYSQIQDLQSEIADTIVNNLL
ncbi:hypothetical protein MNBD_GAMMA21-2589 [hydrothermal vent metagenome]|uniref:Uncharacterized protein n=1 Tax=hydrothermal vent metagenome TaxID=652676 RepID=A0A3B1AIE6_9ZZZZ